MSRDRDIGEQLSCRRAPPQRRNAVRGVLPASRRNCSAACARPAGLLNSRLPERQRLVGADDVAAGILRRHEQRLLARQQPGDLAGRRKPGVLLDRPFVDIGRNRLERNAGIAEQHLPRAALRRQDQRIVVRARWSSHASFRKPLPLPIGEQFHDGRRGFLDRAARHVELRPAEFGAQLPRIGHFVGHRLPIDVIVIADCRRPCSAAGSAGPGSAAPASHAG